MLLWSVCLFEKSIFASAPILFEFLQEVDEFAATFITILPTVNLENF